MKEKEQVKTKADLEKIHAKIDAHYRKVRDCREAINKLIQEAINFPKDCLAVLTDDMSHFRSLGMAFKKLHI